MSEAFPGWTRAATDYVIHTDPWWNPAIESQASDRTPRIGQTRPAAIYRLVAADTIEEKIVQLHHAKRDLADSLLTGPAPIADSDYPFAYATILPLRRSVVSCVDRRTPAGSIGALSQRREETSPMRERSGRCRIFVAGS